MNTIKTEIKYYVAINDTLKVDLLNMLTKTYTIIRKYDELYL